MKNKIEDISTEDLIQELSNRQDVIFVGNYYDASHIVDYMNELDIEPSKENQDIFFNKYSGIGKLGLDFANDDLEEALLTTFNDTKDILKTKLFDCDLSTRVLTILKHHNIKYVSDLMRYTERDLINMKNLGKISLMDIRAFLASHRLSLERYEFDV